MLTIKFRFTARLLTAAMVTTTLSLMIGSGPAMAQFGGPDIVKDYALEKAVRHGEVKPVTYASSNYGVERRMQIYTPPGYDKAKGRYPVLYLVHGGGGNDLTWLQGGKLPAIMDNLLAEKKIVPMIVVLPDGGGLPNGKGMRGQGQQPTPAQIAETKQDAESRRDGFVSDLLTGIIPYVDSHYRSKATAADRAIAGFSFGGAEALWAGLDHPDTFQWLGAFSMGIQGGSTAGANAVAGSGSSGTPEDFVRQHEVFFAPATSHHPKLALIWIGVGSQDGVVGSGPKALADTLGAHGVKSDFHETPGGHNFNNWRDYLHDFAQRLFKR